MPTKKNDPTAKPRFSAGTPKAKSKFVIPSKDVQYSPPKGGGKKGK